jgi:anti-sigma regulatory factor (Ser/Thr protein kinase)
VGGLGIHLVRQLMDGLEYRRQGDRNRLTLRKATGIGGQGDPEVHR